MNNNHNTQKKIAVINDLSGFGKCSLTVTLPIVSMMRVQCCPVITSIFSNHTAYDSYYYEDYTKHFSPYVNEWKKLGLQFEGIYSGFLGSKEQIALVLQFIEDFAKPGAQILVDPVMGDDGKTYATMTQDLCADMKKLATKATILTPNLTEACILTDTEYHDGKWSIQEIKKLANQLLELGSEKIVITGIKQGDFIANYSIVRNEEGKFQRTHKAGVSRCGTGDIFASILAADAVNGVAFDVSVKKASRFIQKCIVKSDEYQIPLTDGVCFEEFLYTLK